MGTPPEDISTGLQGSPTALDVVKLLYEGAEVAELALALEAYVDRRIAQSRGHVYGAFLTGPRPTQPQGVGEFKLTCCPTCGQTIAKAIRP